MSRRALVLAALVVTLGMVSVANAQVLYNQNFDVDSTANWTVNKGPATTDEAHDFFFDYSTVGIPVGAELRRHDARPEAAGQPVDRRLRRRERLAQRAELRRRLHRALRLVGELQRPVPVGGSGSTQLSTYGLGTSGTVPQWPGGTQDSIWFAATGDGNSASDWRAYSPTAPTELPARQRRLRRRHRHAPDARNNSHPYYASFGGDTAPAAQTALFPQQTGTTLVGSAAVRMARRASSPRAAATSRGPSTASLIATVPVADDTVADRQQHLLRPQRHQRDVVDGPATT